MPTTLMCLLCMVKLRFKSSGRLTDWRLLATEAAGVKPRPTRRSRCSRCCCLLLPAFPREPLPGLPSPSSSSSSVSPSVSCLSERRLGRWSVSEMEVMGDASFCSTLFTPGMEFLRRTLAIVECLVNRIG